MFIIDSSDPRQNSKIATTTTFKNEYKESLCHWDVPVHVIGFDVYFLKCMTAGDNPKNPHSVRTDINVQKRKKFSDCN